MGCTAASLSSKVIFTSDNPRYEDPDQIIEEINAGVKPIDFKKQLESHKEGRQLSWPVRCLNQEILF